MPDQKVKKQPPAPWAWLFAAVCFAIPILAIGGAVPTAIGVGGAVYCLAVSRVTKKTTRRRMTHCAVVTTVCWGLFVGLAGGVTVLQKRFPDLMHSKHARNFEKKIPSGLVQQATQIEEQVQQTATRLENATRNVLEDEAVRRKIYSRAIRMRDNIKAAYERRADWEARGRDVATIDKQIAHMEKMHEQSIDFATRFNKISQEELDQIIREGDRKGWYSE